MQGPMRHLTGRRTRGAARSHAGRERGQADSHSIDAEKTREFIAELRWLHDQATPPPWQFGHERPHTATQPARITLQTRDLRNIAYPTEPKPIVQLRWFGSWPHDDRNLIQTTRNALPVLLDLAEAQLDRLEEQAATDGATIATLQGQVDRQTDRIVDLEGACGDLALLVQNGSWHVTDGKLVIEHPRAAELWEGIRAALPLNRGKTE